MVGAYCSKADRAILINEGLIYLMLLIHLNANSLSVTLLVTPGGGDSQHVPQCLLPATQDVVSYSCTESCQEHSVSASHLQPQVPALTLTSVNLRKTRESSTSVTHASD